MFAKSTFLRARETGKSHFENMQFHMGKSGCFEGTRGPLQSCTQNSWRPKRHCRLRKGQHFHFSTCAPPVFTDLSQNDPFSRIIAPAYVWATFATIFSIKTVCTPKGP